MLYVALQQFCPHACDSMPLFTALVAGEREEYGRSHEKRGCEAKAGTSGTCPRQGLVDAPSTVTAVIRVSKNVSVRRLNTFRKAWLHQRECAEDASDAHLAHGDLRY